LFDPINVSRKWLPQFLWFQVTYSARNYISAETTAAAGDGGAIKSYDENMIFIICISYFSAGTFNCSAEYDYKRK